MDRRRIFSFLIALLALSIGAAAIVLVEFPSSHPSDSVLSSNLFNHEASFNQLVKMATEDTATLAVGTSYVILKNTDGWPPYIYLYEDKPWPGTEAEVGFSKARWDAYRSLFTDLNLKMGLSRHEDMLDAIFFTASFDSSEI